MLFIFTSPKQTESLLENGKYNCLVKGNNDFNHGREKDIFLRLHPGQIFDLDDQCKLEFGPKSLHIGVTIHHILILNIMHRFDDMLYWYNPIW